MWIIFKQIFKKLVSDFLFRQIGTYLFNFILIDRIVAVFFKKLNIDIIKQAQIYYF